jgi:hypothetical protein
MPISYDPATETAFDSATGMGVRFVRYDHPQEQRAFYKLHWRGEETTFTADIDSGFVKLRRENPTLDASHLLRMMFDRKETGYNLKLPDALLTDADLLANIDILIELFAENVRRRIRGATITVVFDSPRAGQAAHRSVTLPPLLPSL